MTKNEGGKMKKQLAIALTIGVLLAASITAYGIGNTSDGGYYMGPGMMYYGEAYGMPGYYGPAMMYTGNYPVYQNQSPFNLTNILLGILIVLVIVLIAILALRRK